MIPHLTNAKRVVLKIGSALVAERGQPRLHWMQSIAADIATLQAGGTDVILVTSGAIALGRPHLSLPQGALKLEEKQAAAAYGQPLLMRAWQESLAPHKLHSAQILLTTDDTENRQRYLNARHTMETLLQLKTIPIINENDTVATAEIRYGDNDRLAARVAAMMSADVLVLFSDVDGLYNKNPKRHADAQLIPVVNAITPEIEACAGDDVSTTSHGGMTTKIAAAKIALAAGCHMLIARGDVDHPLSHFTHAQKGTWFVANDSPLSARKHWIASAIKPAGTLVVDAGAEVALKSGKSLLPAGVTRVDGAFDCGDTLIIVGAAGVELGRGLASYSADDARKIIGKRSGEIEDILGFHGGDALIHRDDMVLQ